MAEEHHAHAVVLVHVGVEHAHMRVVTGDEVLDYHLGGVAGFIGASDDRLQLLRRVQDVGLLAPLEVDVQPFHAVGRFHGHRVVERQVAVLAGLHLVGGHRLGLGMGQPVLLAHPVERGLVRQLARQLDVERVVHVVAFQVVAALAEQVRVHVAAGDQQQRAVRVLLLEPLAFGQHGVPEGHEIVEVGDDVDVDDPAELRGAQLEVGVGPGCDAVRLVEGAGHAVDVDVTAQQDR